VGICAHSDGRRTIFLDTCCCDTHNTGQCGCRTRCRFSAMSIVGSPMAKIDKEEEPIANHEKEQQQPPMQDVPHDEPPRRSQRARRSAISDDYEVYVSKEIQMKGDHTSFEEGMRRAHSSKWLETVEDEMKSMSTNKV
jgi:hypothetical protein